MFDYVSRGTSQLPVQITWHEKEDNYCWEKRETEFSDYIGGFVYGFFVWYTFHVFRYN